LIPYGREPIQQDMMDEFLRFRVEMASIFREQVKNDGGI
jgi:hypothetical protein